MGRYLSYLDAASGIESVRAGRGIRTHAAQVEPWIWLGFGHGIDRGIGEIQAIKEASGGERGIRTRARLLATECRKGRICPRKPPESPRFVHGFVHGEGGNRAPFLR